MLLADTLQAEIINRVSFGGFPVVVVVVGTKQGTQSEKNAVEIIISRNANNDTISNCMFLLIV